MTISVGRFLRMTPFFNSLLERDPPAELARLARRILARHLADAGARRIAGGEYALAAGLLGRSLHQAADPLLVARAATSGVRGRLAGRRDGRRMLGKAGMRWDSKRARHEPCSHARPYGEARSRPP